MQKYTKYVLASIGVIIISGTAWYIAQPAPVYTYEECLQNVNSIIEAEAARCTLYETVYFGTPVAVPPVITHSSSSAVSSALSSFITDSSVSLVTSTISSSAASVPPITKNPASVRLSVPFAVQAPFGNWDPPFDEACEEASLLMVEHFYNGKDLNDAIAKEAIIELTNWEATNGYAIDIPIAKLATLAQEYYNRTSTMLTGNQVTVPAIQTALAAGKPVIVPAAGRMLGNPYFSGQGPPYHMLVLIGYDDTYFYTNDPGTKRGAGYKYTKDVLMNAIHDWNGSVDTIAQGQKAVLIVER